MYSQKLEPKSNNKDTPQEIAELVAKEFDFTAEDIRRVTKEPASPRL